LKKKDHYVFPAIFHRAEDGISVEFPDLQGCLTCGDATEEAVKNAKEAMALHLYGMEQDKEKIPSPSDIGSIKLAANEVLMLVEVWMPVFRDAVENKSIKKTLTIPKWLDDLAVKQHVNFSKILQSALKNHLGVDDDKKDIS